MKKKNTLKRLLIILQFHLRFAVTFLIIFAGCAFPGSKQETSRIRFSIQNTLSIERKNVPIVLTLEQLQKVNPDFSLNAFAVVTGKAPRETPILAQADDLDYDGVRDQLIFLLDLDAEETKEISILYDPNVKATFTMDVNKQTRAGIFPELNAKAALESDLIAYLLKSDGAIIAYGKKRHDLFSIDALFQSELDFGNQQLTPEFRNHFQSNMISLTQTPQALIIEVKEPEKSWVIRDLENQEDYYIRKQNEQLNLSKSIGLSLNSLLDPEDTMTVALTPQEGLIGCGGFALWNRKQQKMIPLPSEGDYVRILANGAMRSVVQRILPAWNINGETFQLTLTTYVYGKNPWLEQNIHIDKALPEDYAIVVGIPKLDGTNGHDDKQNMFWSWGTDPNDTHPLGVALLYPKTQEGVMIDSDSSLITMIFTPNDNGHITYRALALWEGGINGVQTESAFRQQLQFMTTTMENQPRIKFLPLEEK